MLPGESFDTVGINRRMPREFDGLKLVSFALPPPSGMLVEIKATYKSPCINDIVIRLFPASAGMNRS